MRIIVDKNKCMGCGTCADAAPDLLEMKNGKSSPIEGVDISQGESLENAKLAVEVCPVRAITLEK